MTAEQIRARFAEIAPSPAGEGPGTGRALAAWLLVSAQRAWYRGLRPGGTDADISMAGGSFATAHALLALEWVSDSHADIAAAEILAAIGADEAAGERVARHLRDLGIDTDEVNALEDALQALPEAEAAREPDHRGDLTGSERDLIRADLGQLLEALALGDHARPESAHEVMQQCIAQVAKFHEGAGLLGRAIAGNVRAMEAARIDMLLNGPHAGMQWILNSLPDQWDGPEGTAWDGKESAREWFDRTESRGER